MDNLRKNLKKDIKQITSQERSDRINAIIKMQKFREKYGDKALEIELKRIWNIKP